MRTNQILPALPRLASHLLQGANLAFLSLFARGHSRKAISYLTTSLFYYQLAAGKGLPQKPLDEIVPRKENVTEVRLAKDSWLNHWQSFVGVDLISLCLITRLTQPKTIFEIGTFEGVSAVHFALNSPSDCRIYTLDLPSDESAAPNLRLTVADEEVIEVKGKTVFNAYPEESKKVVELHGDSAFFDFEPYVGKVDLFFVDGSHSYEYVKSDSENAFRCVRKNGVILWHDYGRYGPHEVSKYLHQIAKQKEIYRLPGGSLAIHVVP
ncbi:MAG TPA: class I SAM-dependent methyltransferase [Pyrinomonadaceae bacterium]|nr:class I SAM-dependent methyltransferase [Pyrinomonadaceae bacterium]